MDTNQLEEAIAVVAHACWCTRMRHAGWKAGATTDVEWRTHEALADYPKLSPFQREQLREWVGLDELKMVLADTADAALRESEMSLRDMKVGLRVQLDNRGADLVEPEDEPVGKVVSWEVANPKTGRLSVIRVEWPDGEVVEYSAEEKALLVIDRA